MLNKEQIQTYNKEGFVVSSTCLSNDKVKELYNDTMDYKKYKINLKRTEMTSQY